MGVGSWELGGRRSASVPTRGGGSLRPGHFAPKEAHPSQPTVDCRPATLLTEDVFPDFLGFGKGKMVEG